MIFIVFWKVISWILLFHLLFWCHKIIFRWTGYGTVFAAISRYWEQTQQFLMMSCSKRLRMQNCVTMLEKSQKDWENSVLWKKKSRYVIRISCEQFFDFFMVLGRYTLALLGNNILIKIYVACGLGRNQLIIRFVSAAHPNLELENPTFFGRKNEVSATDDMWLQ